MDQHRLIHCRAIEPVLGLVMGKLLYQKFSLEIDCSEQRGGFEPQTPSGNTFPITCPSTGSVVRKCIERCRSTSMSYAGYYNDVYYHTFLNVSNSLAGYYLHNLPKQT